MDLKPLMNRRRGIVFALFEMASCEHSPRSAWPMMSFAGRQPSDQLLLGFLPESQQIWVWVGGSPPVGKWVTSPVTSRVSRYRLCQLVLQLTYYPSSFPFSIFNTSLQGPPLKNRSNTKPGFRLGGYLILRERDKPYLDIYFDVNI